MVMPHVNSDQKQITPFDLLLGIGPVLLTNQLEVVVQKINA
jgi:hypothetical protein